MLQEEVQMLTAELEYLKANIDAVVENHLRIERERIAGIQSELYTADMEKAALALGIRNDIVQFFIAGLRKTRLERPLTKGETEKMREYVPKMKEALQVIAPDNTRGHTVRATLQVLYDEAVRRLESEETRRQAHIATLKVGTPVTYFEHAPTANGRVAAGAVGTILEFLPNGRVGVAFPGYNGAFIPEHLRVAPPAEQQSPRDAAEPAPEPDPFVPWIRSVEDAEFIFGHLTYNDEKTVQADGGVDPDWTDQYGTVRWAGTPYAFNDGGRCLYRERNPK